MKIEKPNDWYALTPTDNQHILSWEYQEDIDDDETYISGNIYLDDYDDKYVLDFDGAYDLPSPIKKELKKQDYDINELL